MAIEEQRRDSWPNRLRGAFALPGLERNVSALVDSRFTPVFEQMLSEIPMPRLFDAAGRFVALRVRAAAARVNSSEPQVGSHGARKSRDSPRTRDHAAKSAISG